MRSILHLALIATLSFFNSVFATPDFSKFEVHSIPDGPHLPPSWAGRLPVPNSEPGNALFFWLFNTEDPAYDDNLIIWFNGGPGCSSLKIGLTTGNGPIKFDQDNSNRMVTNDWSWTKFGNVLYIDQPVGIGYSIISDSNPAVDNDQAFTYLYDWLKSFFEHFPQLQSKQLILAGESWGGITVSNLAKSIVEHQDTFPLKLQSIVIGSGAIGNGAAAAPISMPKYLESQNSVINLPDDVLSVFTEASKKCGFDDILAQVEYPPKGKISIPGNPEELNRKRRRDFADIYENNCNTYPKTAEEVRAGIYENSCGDCATSVTARDYLNTSNTHPCFSAYDVSDNCSSINYFELVGRYFNRTDVQAALNVPNTTTEKWPFLYCYQKNITGVYNPPPEPPVYALIPNLATLHNVSLHIYWGDNDIVLNHVGAELMLQNMTWNGEQGFSSPPDRLFYGDNAAPQLPNNSTCSDKRNSPGTDATTRTPADDIAGRWISERGVTYHLFHGAGHSVFLKKPREMFAYWRDVVVSKASATAAPTTKH